MRTQTVLKRIEPLCIKADPKRATQLGRIGGSKNRRDPLRSEVGPTRTSWPASKR